MVCIGFRIGKFGVDILCSIYCRRSRFMLGRKYMKILRSFNMFYMKNGNLHIGFIRCKIEQINMRLCRFQFRSRTFWTLHMLDSRCLMVRYKLHNLCDMINSFNRLRRTKIHTKLHNFHFEVYPTKYIQYKHSTRFKYILHKQNGNQNKQTHQHTFYQDKLYNIYSHINILQYGNYYTDYSKPHCMFYIHHDIHHNYYHQQMYHQGKFKSILQFLICISYQWDKSSNQLINSHHNSHSLNDSYYNLHQSFHNEFLDKWSNTCLSIGNYWYGTMYTVCPRLLNRLNIKYGIIDKLFLRCRSAMGMLRNTCVLLGRI